MSDVRRILSAIEQGDPAAAELLVPLVLGRAVPPGSPGAWPV
jgi:hypothetical protein